MQFLLALFAILLVCNLLVHASYIKALEVKINYLAGEPIAIWENEITENFLFGKEGTFLKASIVIGVALIGYYLCLIIFTLKNLSLIEEFPFILGVIIVEVSTLLALIAFTFIDKLKPFDRAISILIPKRMQDE